GRPGAIREEPHGQEGLRFVHEVPAPARHLGSFRAGRVPPASQGVTDPRSYMHRRGLPRTRYTPARDAGWRCSSVVRLGWLPAIAGDTIAPSRPALEPRQDGRATNLPYRTQFEEAVS